MTDLRQAAQQALEALGSGNPYHQQLAAKVLRTALEQQAEPPPEWLLIKNILAEYGLDAIAFVAEWKAAQQQAEPTCPDCKAAVLYECVACSNNNYPPKQQAEPDRRRLQAEGKHPAPCARHCEAKAFEIEIRSLKSALETQAASKEDMKVYRSIVDNYWKGLAAKAEQQAEPVQEPYESPYNPNAVEYQYHYPDGSWSCSNGEVINGMRPDRARSLYALKDNT